MSQSMSEKLTCSLLLLAVYLELSGAIRCYQCNSEYDPRCGDQFDAYSLGQVNCSMKLQLEHLSGQESVLCRKTRQKIFGKVRIIRDCGYVHDVHDDRECFRRTGTFEVESIFCSCTGDLCNATPATTHQSVFGYPFYIMIAIVSSLLASRHAKLCSMWRLFQ